MHNLYNINYAFVLSERINHQNEEIFTMISRSVLNKYLLSLIVSLAITFKSNATDLQTFPSSLGYKTFQVATYIGLSLGVVAISTLAHEFGHAVMGKLLIDSPLDVTIGSLDEEAPVKAKIGCVSIRGWNPFQGYTKIINDASSRIGTILIFLAGPCAGASAATIVFNLSKNSFIKFICLSMIMNNIIDNLNPGESMISEKGDISYTDGAAILELCIGQEKTEKIIHFLKRSIPRYTLITAEILALLKMDAQFNS